MDREAITHPGMPTMCIPFMLPIRRGGVPRSVLRLAGRDIGVDIIRVTGPATIPVIILDIGPGIIPAIGLGPCCRLMCVLMYARPIPDDIPVPVLITVA